MRFKSNDPLLVRATRKGSIKLVNLLLATHKEPDIPGFQNRRAIHEAVSTENIPMLLTLLRAGASVNLASDDGETPLHLAAANGNLQIFDILMEHKADPFAITKKGQTITHLAAMHGHAKVLYKIHGHPGEARVGED